MQTLYQFIKQAGLNTYDYKASSRRNFYPKPSGIKPVVREADENPGKTVSIPKNEKPKSELQEYGKNKYWDPDGYPTWRFTHSFSPTISGTGYGKPYWNYPKDPYQDSQ